MMLDIETISIFGALMQAAIVLARLCVQWFGKTYSGLRQWTAASVILVVVFSLLSVYGIVPFSRSFMIAVGLSLVVVPLHLDGLLAFTMPDAARLRRMALSAAVTFIVVFEAAPLTGSPDILVFLPVFGSMAVFSLASLGVALRAVRLSGLSAIWLLVGCIAIALIYCGGRLALAAAASGPLLTPDGMAIDCIAFTLQQTLSAIAELTIVAQRARRDLELSQAALLEQARSDALTGLRNRRAFMEVGHAGVDTARRRNRPLALLLCDLDHFKRVNDVFGHAVGDTVLQLVGSALAEIARSGECAARIGGEEFAILLPETDLMEAEGVAERFRRAIEAITPPDPGPDRITMSIGIAALAEAPATLEDLMVAADGALYRAKSAGRNRWMAA